MTPTEILIQPASRAATATPTSSAASIDDRYARQLDRRLARDRSAASATSAAREASFRNEATETRRSDRNEPIEADARERPSGATEASEWNEASTNRSPIDRDRATDDDDSNTVAAAPPTPWQHDAPAPRRRDPAAEAAGGTFGGPAQQEGGEPLQNNVTPAGLLRVDEAAPAPPTGIIAPPGAVIVTEAAASGSPASLDSDSAAPSAELPNAGPIPESANVDAIDQSAAEKASQSDGAVTAIAGKANTAASETATASADAQIETAAAVQNPSVTATNAIASVESKGVRSRTSEELESGSTDADAAAATAGDPSTTQTTHHHAAAGGEQAANVVADATARAVQAIESTASQSGSTSAPTIPATAVPTALHAALAERAADAIDRPDGSPSDGTVGAAIDAGVTGVRSEAKSTAASSVHSTRGDQPQPGNSADALPRHAAAALRAAAGFDRPIRIRLSPAELGALQVEVSRHDGAMNARFEVTTAAAQSLLHDHLPTLRESLGRLGLTIDRFDIRLVDASPRDDHSDSQSQHGGGQNRGEGEQQQQPRQEQPRQEQPRQQSRDEASTRAISERGSRTDKADESPRQTSHSQRRGAAADLIDIQV